MRRDKLEVPDKIDVELTSGDDSYDSNISEQGLPDGDLNYVIDDDTMEQIAERRKKRRLSKLQARMDASAIAQVI